MKRSFGLLACLLTVAISILGCTGTTSQNAVSLLLEYNNEEQTSYVKALWAPEKGTMEIDKDPVLSYPSNDAQVIAVHWEGLTALPFYQRSHNQPSAIQARGVKVNVVSLANSLPIYYDPTVIAYTTNEAIYALLERLFPR